VLLCCVFPRVAAGVVLPPIVAQTGFNDATGLHGNPTVFNPYALDDSLPGGGNGEPGWARPWLGDSDKHIVTRSTIYEGDGALAMTWSNLFAHRSWSVPQSGQFMIDQWVRLPAGGFGYGATSSEAANGARTSEGAVWRFRTNGAIEVLDGEQNGCSTSCNFENTGFAWTPDTWHRVTVLVDLSARRDYVFYFDGQPYQGSDRLCLGQWKYHGADQNFLVVILDVLKRPARDFRFVRQLLLRELSFNTKAFHDRTVRFNCFINACHELTFKAHRAPPIAPCISSSRGSWRLYS